MSSCILLFLHLFAVIYSLNSEMFLYIRVKFKVFYKLNMLKENLSSFKKWINMFGSNQTNQSEIRKLKLLHLLRNTVRETCDRDVLFSPSSIIGNKT